jgi:hypothetical protein
MVTISNNDLKQLLLYVQATDGKVQEAKSSLRMCNRLRLAKITLQKLMKRADVQRIMGCGKGVVVADK